MKPDFFDNINLDEIYNPDKSENGIDNYFKPPIICKSRYILAQLQRQKLFSINFRPDFGPPFLQLTEPQ